MLEILLKSRLYMIDKIYSCQNNSEYKKREDLLQALKSFDKEVLGKYIDSKEVNSQLLEELKFYEN